MPENNTSKRISAGLLFLICSVIGAIAFTGIYGIKILDPQNCGWLLDNDHDLRQHFIGWCAYRSDPWHFPIGLIDSLSYPNSMSVIYTDSIPIFAVFFKILNPILPQMFQYFGLFGILSFALMGGFSSLLLRRFISDDISCMLGSVFYVVSAPVIHRMYFHTALGAQWLIIAALVLWVYDDLIRSTAVKVFYWGLLGFLCVGIHSYFLPMTGMILAALMITQIARKKGWILPASELMSFCAFGLINLYILGGFYGVSSASGFGLGTFVSNLNTFINPWEIGQFLPQLPLQNYFQYEGMAYLGVGILMLFVIVAGGLVFRKFRKVPESAFHSTRIYGRVTVALVAVSFAAAVFPNVSYNDIILMWIPCPKRIEDILSIFRSNGRLIWPAMYILVTCALAFTAYTFRHTRRIAALIIAVALVLQIADMTNAFASRFEFYTSDHPVDNPWDDPEASEFAKGSKEFIFLYTENDITLPTGFYGYLHGMRQNNFYFARDIEDKVSENIDICYAELADGNLRDDAVYVIKQEEYESNRKDYDRLNADFMEFYGHVIFKARRN